MLSLEQVDLIQRIKDRGHDRFAVELLKLWEAGEPDNSETRMEAYVLAFGEPKDNGE